MKNNHESADTKMLSYALIIIFLVTSLFSFAGNCPSLSGEYAIGKNSNSDFSTLTEAVDAIKCGGVSGPVTFILAKGIYEEHVILSSLNGVSAFNPLRIESETKNNADVIIRYPKGDATLVLSSCDVSLENITVDHREATYGNCMRVEGKASRLRFKNVVFDGVEMPSEGNNAETILFTSTGSKEDVVFQDCEVNYGTVGILKTGVNEETPDMRTIITGTLFISQSEASIVITNDEAPMISSNVVSAMATTPGFQAISLNNVSGTAVINKNIVNIPEGATALSMKDCNASATAPTQITNNNFTINGTTTAMGINLSGRTDNLVLNFNRIKIPVNASDATAQGFYRCAATGQNINVLNNLFLDMNTNTYTVLGNSYKDFFNQLPSQSNRALAASSNSITMEKVAKIK